jgi:hypothetical protein
MRSQLDLNVNLKARVRGWRAEVGEQKMDELAREFAATHDPEIIKELYKLGRELEKIEKL